MAWLRDLGWSPGFLEQTAKGCWNCGLWIQLLVALPRFYAAANTQPFCLHQQPNAPAPLSALGSFCIPYMPSLGYSIQVPCSCLRVIKDSEVKGFSHSMLSTLKWFSKMLFQTPSVLRLQQFLSLKSPWPGDFISHFRETSEGIQPKPCLLSSFHL